MDTTKLYVNKRDSDVTAKITKYNEKYGTLDLEYVSGENAGKVTQISLATLKRWWRVTDEAVPETEEATEEKQEEEPVPLVTKVTPQPKNTKLKVTRDKAAKDNRIEYVKLLCGRNNLQCIPKKTHPDDLIIKTEAGIRLGNVKVNYNSYVLYSRRILTFSDDKSDKYLFDADHDGSVKIKFAHDDGLLEYAVERLIESEEKTKNGKN